jgi:pilus assembly protein CpaB
MNNSRAWLVLVVAVVSGLLAVVLAARWLVQRSSDTGTLVVAARDIELGTVLDKSMFNTITWPSGSVPDGGFRTAQELEGRVVKTAFARGEALLDGKLAPKGTRGGLSAVIADGKRAITVKVNEVVGVAGFALPGSFVDVMVHATVDDRARGQGSPVSRIVLERILVLAVAQEASRDETKPKVVNAVTLEVTPQQAELLDVARSVGNLSLVLRNQVDRVQAATGGTGKAELFQGPQAAAVASPPSRGAQAQSAAAPPARPAVRPAAPAVVPEDAPGRTRVEVIRGVVRSEAEI